MDDNWIISPAINEYVSKYSEKETETLAALNEATHAEVRGAHMISGALQGAFLSMISQIMQPNNILELGTYTGYSAICLAKGLPADGKVHTIDIDDKLDAMRQQYWKEAGLTQKIVQHIGTALSIIPTLDISFDLVFLDADKGNYSAYFDLLMDVLPLGAVILADNVLFHGEVVKPEEEQSKAAKHIQKFNDHVAKSGRVETVMLPLRDGMSIIRKIK